VVVGVVGEVVEEAGAAVAVASVTGAE
jgi:hypothetical protein